MKKDKVEQAVYVLKLREEDARIVSRACELYMRLHIGQFNELIFELMNPKPGDDSYCQKRDIAESLLMIVRSLIFPELAMRAGASHGAGRTEEDGRAWNVHQVLRNKIAWHNHPEGGVTVNFHPPMNLCGIPLPECMVERSEADAE